MTSVEMRNRRDLGYLFRSTLDSNVGTPRFFGTPRFRILKQVAKQGKGALSSHRRGKLIGKFSCIEEDKT